LRVREFLSSLLSYPGHVQLSIHEQGEFERPADGQDILFGEDQLGDPLPVVQQLALSAHAGHVTGICYGAQHATVFGPEGPV
jgi:hypothetical protein